MTAVKQSSYHTFFDYLYTYYNDVAYLETDPLEYYYLSHGNKEYCAFIASVFAYGRVASIRQFLSSYFTAFTEHPIRSNTPSTLYYRFQKQNDIDLFNQFMFEIYSTYNSLETYFLEKASTPEVALACFIEDAHSYGAQKGAGKGFYFLFPNPKKSSAKRIRMFLRWMIRHDTIDTGHWNSFEAADLLYPLDTHIIRFAYHHGIISSESNSYKNTVMVTNYFQLFSESDPVKYDFPLSRLGIMYNCQYVKSDSCLNCPHIEQCPF